MAKPFTLSARDVLHGLASLDLMRIAEELALRSGGIGCIANGFWVVSDLGLLDDVLVKRARIFNKEGNIYDLLTQRNFPGDTGGVLDGGPFTQSDLDTWRLQREVCNRYFKAAELGDIGRQTILSIEDFMLDWRSEEDADILDTFKRTSLSVLSHHLFGGKIGADFSSKIARIAPRYFEKMAWQLVLGMFPTRNLTGWKSYESLGAEFVAIIGGVIDEALDNPTRFAGTLLGDLLEAFGTRSPAGISLTQENRRLVVGTIGTMYLAGFDSTAVVATHACLMLAKDIRLQAHLRDELWEVFQTGPILPERLGELRNLQAFWQWMLHEHTAFRIIFRNVAEDCKLGGQELRQNDQLLLALHAAHMKPENRMTMRDFIGKPSARVREGHLPYGKGQRKCIGAPMADIQGPLMIAAVLKHYRISPTWPNGTRRRTSMTSAPVNSNVKVSRIVS